MMCQDGLGIVVFGLFQPNTAKPYKSINRSGIFIRNDPISFVDIKFGLIS